MKVDECIFFQLAKASQTAHRFWGHKISGFNVTPAQAMILNFLSDEDEITSRHLGERTQLDSATLTGILDRLEAMELIERKANPDDRRAISICLTDRGKELSGKTRMAMEEANMEFFEGFSPEEEADIRSLLTRIREQHAFGVKNN